MSFKFSIDAVFGMRKGHIITAVTVSGCFQKEEEFRPMKIVDEKNPFSLSSLRKNDVM